MRDADLVNLSARKAAPPIFEALIGEVDWSFLKTVFQGKSYREMAEAMRDGDIQFDVLASAYEQLTRECAGAHRAARRNRGAFARATVIAAAGWALAIAGWLVVWLR